MSTWQEIPRGWLSQYRSKLPASPWGLPSRPRISDHRLPLRAVGAWLRTAVANLRFYPNRCRRRQEFWHECCIVRHRITGILSQRFYAILPRP
jgi:hypothetical protein